MPNRILKESICTSASIDALTSLQEIFYYRLIVNVDDYGRMDARIPILRSRLFPLKTIPDGEILEAVKVLQKRKMIDLYRVEDSLYLQICSWEKHQQVRAKKSKCPTPVEFLQTSEIICNQMQSNVPVIQFNTIQSESYSRERNAPAPAREKKAYGSFRNVMLTEEEHEKLLKEIPHAEELIERFSKRLAAKGYKYSDHYAALLVWSEEDLKDEPEGSFDVDDFFQAALERSYGNLSND